MLKTALTGGYWPLVQPTRPKYSRSAEVFLLQVKGLDALRGGGSRGGARARAHESPAADLRR